MTWLITTGPRSSAAASCCPDHSAHPGSLVSRSSRTFESTRVALSSSLATGEGHDLVGTQGDLATAQQGFDHPCAPPAWAAQGDYPGDPVLDHDVHLVARLQPQVPADLLGDRDLTLARDPHPVRVAT